MPEKLPSEIIKIELDDATFRGTHVVIEPTYVNFFFGNNGTGKSTIAKAIQSGTGVTYAPGRSHADYIPLVYNQDFINHNVANFHSLPGVFTINDVNVKMYVSYIHFVFLWCSRRGNGQGYHVDLALYMLTHVLFSCGFPGSGKWSTP